MHYFQAGLSTDNVLFHHSSVHEEEEPFEPTAEIEAQTIGNLLPDEDDLFSEVFNELDFGSDLKGNTEDFDLFSSIGGMELEGDETSLIRKRDFNFNGSSKGLLASNNKLAPSWTGSSNQCLMRKCNKLENNGAGMPREANEIMSKQSMFGGFSNGSLKGLHSSSPNVSSDGGSYIMNSLPSLLNVSSANHSKDFVNFGGNYISSSEPRSFPDCENHLNNFMTYESGIDVANMVGSIASDRKNGRNINLAGSFGQPMEPQGGMIGPFGNTTCPVHGHPWKNCYIFHHNSMGHKVWPNLPILSNIINAPSPPQNSGFSAYCSGSLGNINSVNNFPMHPIARGSPIPSHSVQNFKKSLNEVMNSSPQTAHSLGSTREIWKNLSRRRNQGNYTHNRKEFELDIERILRGEDVRTTLMLKNIPNKYSSKMLLAAIDEQCKGIYDFVYLPIDFKNNCNVGYAFINLIDPLQIVPFYKSFSGKKWEKFNSEKVAALAYARIQGKSALIAHFQNSTLMNEDKRCRPVLFCTDGPNAGEQEPFPVGSNIRMKSGKARGSINEENRHYYGSPSTSPNSLESDQGNLSPKSVIA